MRGRCGPHRAGQAAFANMLDARGPTSVTSAAQPIPLVDGGSPPLTRRHLDLAVAAPGSTSNMRSRTSVSPFAVALVD